MVTALGFSLSLGLNSLLGFRAEGPRFLDASKEKECSSQYQGNAIEGQRFERIFWFSSRDSLELLLHELELGPLRHLEVVSGSHAWGESHSAVVLVEHRVI